LHRTTSMKLGSTNNFTKRNELITRFLNISLI
jgi:hypothetical protein